MATAAWLAWSQSPSASRIVLADLQAGMALRGWTFDSATAVYRLAWDPYSHPTAVRPDRGLYRGLDSVTENGAALTLRANLAGVQANAGSYWYDEPNQLLYVRTTGSVNPDTVSVVMAIFHLCVATEPVTFAGQRPYDGQMAMSGMPTLQSQQSDPLLGVSITPSGTLTLANADGFWDTLAAQSAVGLTGWVFTNMTVTLRIGGGALAFSDYELQPPLQISQPPAANLDTCIFQLRALDSALNTAFPQNTYSSPIAWWGAPSALAGFATAYLPMFWGTVLGAPTQRMDLAGFTGPGGHPYLTVIDPAVLGSSAQLTVLGGRVKNKTDGTIVELRAGVDLFYNNTITQILYETEGTYSLDDYDLFVDVQTASGSTGLPIWQTFGAIAHQILSFCHVPDAQIDLTSIANADAAAPPRLGVYVAGGSSDVATLTSGQDLINLLERSVFGSVTPNQNYPFGALVWDPSFTLATLPILDETDILAFAVDDTVQEQLSSSVTVQYAKQQGFGTFSLTSASSTEAQVAIGQANSLTLETALIDQEDAADYAVRALLISSKPTLRLKITTGVRLMNANLWDKWRIQATRGPSTTAGSFDQILEIVSISKRLADLQVDVVFGNQRGLGEAVKCIAPPGTPNWASATSDQKRQYLFAVDDTQQRAGAADPASFRPGAWW